MYHDSLIHCKGPRLLLHAVRSRQCYVPVCQYYLNHARPMPHLLFIVKGRQEQLRRDEFVPAAESFVHIQVAALFAAIEQVPLYIHGFHDSDAHIRAIIVIRPNSPCIDSLVADNSYVSGSYDKQQKGVLTVEHGFDDGLPV